MHYQKYYLELHFICKFLFAILNIISSIIFNIISNVMHLKKINGKVIKYIYFKTKIIVFNASLQI